MKPRFSISVISILFVGIIFNSCEKDPKEDVRNEFTLAITAVNGTVIVCVDEDTLTESSKYIIEKDKTAVLTAVENNNYQFAEWGGDLSGLDNPQSIIMSEDKTVVASFGEDQDPPYEAGDKKTFIFDNGRSSITMIYCPGGTFLSNKDDSDGDFEDGPPISCDPFWISETEITNEMLARVYSMTEGIDFNDGSVIIGNPGVFNKIDKDAHNYLSKYEVKWGGNYLIFKGEVQGYEYDFIEDIFFKVYPGRENQPCKEVTWFGSVIFCNWLTNIVLGSSAELNHRVYSNIDEDWIDDETSANLNKSGFRLPSSAEWECAARWQGSDDSNNAHEWPEGSNNYWTPGEYASGARAPTSDVVATSAVAVYRYYDAIKPNPTASDNVKGDRLPNSLGVYDMSGNVQEWLFDESINGSGRLLRGGGFVSQHYYIRIGEPPYGGMYAGGSGSDLGFRVVMAADE